ncbi:uncharacterized protein [Dermacentor andersoni]|uniref:uncharacterized protein n=1 Tax=Dermacentor andersoni TaxID=34620 RepID=UPI0024165670|nr:uncharacterized protein LOC129387043 [Dermacentor andersoni]
MEDDDDDDEELEWCSFSKRDLLGGPWTPSEEQLLWRGAFILILSTLFTIACMLVFLNIGRVNMSFVLDTVKNENRAKNSSSNATGTEALAKMFAIASSRSPFRVDQSWSWGAKERRAEQDLVTGSDNLLDEGRRDGVGTDDSRGGYVQLSEW